MRRSCQIAVRRLALLAAIAESPLPALEGASASVEVRWHAAPVAIAPAYRSTLAEAVEALARGSLHARQSTPSDTPRELEILVKYDPPLVLELPLREALAVPVRSLTLFTTAVDEDGWPTLLASTDEGSWSLAKYSGPLVLDLFCSPELEGYTSADFRSNCHLAPSPRGGGEGSASRLEEQILGLETSWNQAHLHGDVEALDKLWAPNLTVVVPEMQPFAKPDLLAMWRSTKVAFARYETSDVRIQSSGGTVVVTGRLRRSRDFGGRVKDEDWLFTKTYARVDGGWLVMAYHASVTPPP